MSFSGFGPQALPFFKALAFHQTKEWFEANRAIYESDVKKPFGDLVEALAAALADAGLPLKGDRKSSLFRLHRDVRFAKDKNPYKTHAGAVLTRSGAKNDPGLLYIHIDPTGCFVAAGFYYPEPPRLAAMRRAVADQPARFRQMTAALEQSGLALSIGDSLTRLPRGFEGVADPDLAVAVKRKSFTCSRPVPHTRIGETAMVAECLQFAHDAMPLLDWGWAAGDVPVP